MTNIKPLDIRVAGDIADKVRQLATDSPHPVGGVHAIERAVMAVLLNYGDAQRIAHCTAGDWHGRKESMDKTDAGLPICPRCGASCTEEADAPHLAIVTP